MLACGETIYRGAPGSVTDPRTALRAKSWAGGTGQGYELRPQHHC
jgi:hypothetical protein